MIDHWLEWIAELVQCESPAGEVAALHRSAELIQRLWAPLGAACTIRDSSLGPHLLFEVPARDSEAAPVLLVGHHDTVHPVGSLAEMPWRVADGIAYGPGCYDMKAGLVVAAAAVAAARDSGRAHPPITMLITADEEVGSPTSREVITAVADRVQAALGFESPHPGGRLKRGRHGSTRLRVAVTGRSAHAALDPDSGVSAIDELVDQLTGLRSVVDRPGVLANVGSLHAPGRTNVVNDHAEAEIGLRFADAQVEQEVLMQVLQRPAHDPRAAVRAEVLSQRPAWTAPATDHLLEVAGHAATAVGQHLECGPAAGAADTNLIGALGVPTLDGLGPWGAGAHASHEQFVVAALAPRVRLVSEILTRLA